MNRAVRTRSGGPRRVVAASVALAAAVLAGPDVVDAAEGADSGVKVQRIDRQIDQLPVPGDEREILRLSCHARPDAGFISCGWREPTHPDTAGVRLIRVALGQDGGRTVVYRSGDLTQTTFVDEAVRPGVRYAYVLTSVDAAGRTIGISRPSVAGFVRPDADVEVLRLQCAPATATRIGCEWSLPSERAGARVLTLWRSVDGAARERVATFTHPFASSFVDAVPASASRVAYAVVAYDGDREVVARSRADVVALPDREIDVAPIDERPVDVVPGTTVPHDRESDRVPEAPVRDQAPESSVPVDRGNDRAPTTTVPDTGPASAPEPSAPTTSIATTDTSENRSADAPTRDAVRVDDVEPGRAERDR